MAKKREATHYDDKKPMVGHLVPRFAIEMGYVRLFGAKKYDKDNWRGGIGARALAGSMLRHAMAILDGEDIDPESGCHHLAHLAVDSEFLYEELLDRPEFDDRHKVPPSKRIKPPAFLTDPNLDPRKLKPAKKAKGKR